LDAGRDNDRAAYQTAAREAVLYAVAHTTERQAVVREITLIQSALEHGTGRTDLGTIKAELTRQVQTGELITAGDRFTTEAAQQRERAMLDVALRGRGAVAPIMDQHQADHILAATSLNSGQRGAAALVVGTGDRVIAIQGSAGTGKTTMLRQARELIEAQGYRVQGLAPSASAARELAGAGIQSQTLAAFQSKNESGLNSKTVLIVDEAGMVASKDMSHVLHAAEANNARVVLVGDVQQLKAVEAGIPFAQLQQAGISRIEMGEIQRQNDAQLKHAVELAAKGDVERSLVVLNKHVQEIDNHRERYAQIAHDYAALTPAERKETLVLAGTHNARTAINDNVRGELGLAGCGMLVSTLTRNDLTQVQARSSLSYQPGDIVEARKPYESLGMHRGELARVVDVEPGKVTLARSDGEHVHWRPAVQSNMSAYRENIRELSVGDAVRLTANNHAQDLINGDRATVVSIDPDRQTVDLRKANGDAITLDASKPLHMDYGYCSTVHSAQGQTTDRVLIEADTKSATSNESLYYVAISRARSEVTIYTDDKTMLPEAMGREDVKEAALDVKRHDREFDLEI
jgi:ATP-dependent exoDNAse (exonuclease V) alpha subunit